MNYLHDLYIPIDLVIDSSSQHNTMDEAVYGFVIVALIGFFIVSSPLLNKNAGCFNWCDVGKTLVGLALTSVVSLLIKGAVQPVKVVM
jgi:hypothetical protein